MFLGLTDRLVEDALFPRKEEQQICHSSLGTKENASCKLSFGDVSNELQSNVIVWVHCQGPPKPVKMERPPIIYIAEIAPKFAQETHTLTSH